MAVETIPPTKQAPKFSINLLESASTDLYVADALLLAVDRFLDEINDWVKSADAGGITPNHYVQKPVHLASTLLLELRDKIDEAKLTIDNAVDAAIAANLSR
jgi:hypothetical protein